MPDGYNPFGCLATTRVYFLVTLGITGLLLLLTGLTGPYDDEAKAGFGTGGVALIIVGLLCFLLPWHEILRIHPPPSSSLPSSDPPV